MKAIKTFFIYLFFSLLIVISYIYLSNIWIYCPEPSQTQVYLELPILIIIFTLFYFPIKNIFKSVLFATFPFLLSYGLFDGFYYFLRRSPRVSDFKNIFLVADFSPLFTIVLIIIFLSMLFPLVVLIKSFYKQNTKPIFYTTILGKLLALVFVYFYLNQAKLNDYILKNFIYMDWSQSRTIKKNGRVASFIYYNKVSQISYKKIEAYRDNKLNINKLIFGTSLIKKKKNIYIIVLESLVDPRLLKDITYNRSPLSKDLEPYLQGKGFSKVISPIYGGGTAQAEFEVLTAIEALAKVDTVDFNTLMGSKISGFTNMLVNENYKTYATIATSSNYFNSKSAYKSIGFDHLIFLEETKDYHHREGDKLIFDGDLFDYNIKKIKKLSKLKDNYIFYSLGMYGHMPYLRNKQQRKDMIFNCYSNDNRIDRISTQFYYRTKALAKYIKEILAIDPHSIIYITSDHLPPILNGGIEYTASKFTNIALLLVDGKNIKIDGLKYYQVPRYIWSILSDKKEHLKDINQSLEEKVYFKSLSESFSP